MERKEEELFYDFNTKNDIQVLTAEVPGLPENVKV
ncbi:MAG: hypothetical protein QG670_2064 [Thermoproteota archaeon]|nr:hypothetical protein [Thermoproteota archaeon]